VIRSLNTAENAMQMQQLRIDALANNLANVNSTGFRGVLTRVSEQGSPETTANINEGEQAQGVDGALPRPTGRDAANWQPVRPLELYHATDTRGGPVSATGRDTDVAILGRGFFSLQTEAGERYTRGGSFTINNQNELTTPDGTKVLGTGGPIVLNGESFSVEADGRVLVDGAQVAQFKIVDFGDPGRLEHLGSNMMKAPDDMEAQAVPVEEIALAQGHIEGSNVNAIDTLVAMIAAQRAFEVQSKVINTEDEMLSKSVNNLPRVTA
jgi:flagellar basal-body rod protein FlgG